MSPAGDAELLVAARAALLDALDALTAQRDALMLIGAQAIYLHTGGADIALAEATKDSDLAVDPRALVDDPLLDDAMTAAGFHRDLVYPQPGSWLSPTGIPVDLMVPEALAGGGGRRGARIPPHSRHATRRTPGIEAAVVDHAPMTIAALAADDDRRATISVAGPAALLVAKPTSSASAATIPAVSSTRTPTTSIGSSSPRPPTSSPTGWTCCAATSWPARRRRSR